MKVILHIHTNNCKELSGKEITKSLKDIFAKTGAVSLNKFQGKTGQSTNKMSVNKRGAIKKDLKSL